MQIGELSRLTGASPRSLRYYEQLDLISSDRRDNGYREYGDEAVLVVGNVRALLAAGLTMAEITQVGECHGQSCCQQGSHIAHHQGRFVAVLAIAVVAAVRRNEFQLLVVAQRPRARPGQSGQFTDLHEISLRVGAPG